MAILRTWKVKDGYIQYKNDDVIWIEDADALIQRLAMRLRKWIGEWFREEDEGVDWPDIFEAGTDLARVNAIIKLELLKDDLVSSVDSVESEYNGSNRSLKINFEVSSDEISGELSAEVVI